MTTTTPQDFWNSRYQADDYVYGKTPNAFFRSQLDRLTAGNILLPAEGEGRNAVYAATQGWQVTAFDMSREGKRKADALAAERGVPLHYRVGTLDELTFPGRRLTRWHWYLPISSPVSGTRCTAHCSACSSRGAL